MRSYQKVDEFCLPHSLTMRDDNVALGRPVARPRLNGMNAGAQGFGVHGPCKTSNTVPWRGVRDRALSATPHIRRALSSQDVSTPPGFAKAKDFSLIGAAG